MNKSKMSNKTLLDKPPYKQILDLLRNFSSKPGENKLYSLSHRHFLYAFLDEENINKYIKKELQDEIKKYFLTFIPLNFRSNEKERWEAVEKLYFCRGIIRYPKQLTDKLNYLIKREWIKPDGKPKYYNYFITDKYLKDLSQVHFINDIQSWKSEEISDLIPTIINKSHVGAYLLCGLSKEFKDNLSYEEKKHLKKLISNIEKTLAEIYNFKLNKTQTKKTEEFSQKLSFYWHT